MLNISVITAVYNRRETIGQALQSVLSQDHGRVESIVIDGGSSDGTLDVVNRYKDKLGFVISEKDDGIYDALNKGILHSTGEVIGFMHADDLYANDQVLSKVAARFADPAVDIVYGDLVYVSHNEVNNIVRYWKSGEFDVAALKQGWMPPHPTFYARKTLYERLGAFNTSYRIAADYDLMVRFLASGLKADYIPEILVKMRTGGISNRSLKSIMRKSREDLQVVRGNNIGGLNTVLSKNFSKLSQFWRR